VAGEGGDEVLQLEEGMREVRDHLAEEKGARGSSSLWGVGDGGDGGSNAARSGSGSVTSMDGRRRERRGGVLARMMRKRMREEREKGVREAATPILKGSVAWSRGGRVAQGGTMW
jgi:hypothetical protein